MVQSKQWVLAKQPTGSPQLSGPEQTFKLVQTEIPAPKDDQLLLKLQYLSNDPAQRGWIGSTVSPERLYVPQIPEGQVMRARGLCEVVESQSSRYRAGDSVLATVGWSEFACVAASEVQPAPELPGGLNRTHYLGALGMTGMTAYFGLMDVAQVKAGDVVVVSGAAGAVGSMAVQIAKKMVGCRKVIGMAGTDEKCRWVENLGADQCLNYKSSIFKQDLVAATPSPDGFADVYFDNVGGDTLDLMLTRMARHGRVACCGAISNYNTRPDKTVGLKNWFEVISMRIKCEGFIVLDYVRRFGEGREAFQKALSEGKLQVEGSEQVVPATFESIPETWMTLFSGGNTGKLITDVRG